MESRGGHGVWHRMNYVLESLASRKDSLSLLSLSLCLSVCHDLVSRFHIVRGQ